MSFVGFQDFFQGAGDGGESPPCPTINLGPIEFIGDIQWFLTNSGTRIATGAIEGGEGPYTVEVTAGTAPPNTVFTTEESGGDWTWKGTNTGATTRGGYTFTLTATDANGCTGSQEYTIYVFTEFSVTAPIPANDGAEVPFPISGLSSPYTAEQIVQAKVNVSLPNMADLYCSLIDPSFTAEAVFFGNGELSGADMTDAVFFNQVIDNSYPAVTTGTAPYTGTWIDGGSIGSGYAFDVAFAGLAVNGTWVVLLGNTNLAGGTINVVLTFKQ